MYRLCFFAYSLVTFAVVSADRNSILKKGTSVNRKLAGDFAEIIEISLNASRCANVYLADNTMEINDLFAEFVQVYPYEYSLNKTTYWCNGYLAIFASGEDITAMIKNVPTKAATTEILIAMVNEVDYNMDLFNASVYGNANVNIAATNGLWSLSENYLEHREFKNATRQKDMEQKRGTVNLQGRTLQAASLYYPPMTYLSTTYNQTVNGVEAELFNATDEYELDGIEMKLFLLMAKQMNFTWVIRKPNDNRRYGNSNGSKWDGGLIGQMFRKEVDISFSGIWLKLDFYRFANLSRTWNYLSTHFLVPRPKPFSNFWALTRPLSPEIWWTVIAMVIAESLYVYMRARINPHLPSRFHSFVTTWTELVARLVGIALTRNIRGLELQFQLWHLIGVLVVTAYSSSLAANLARSAFEPRIDTTRQFIEANLSWGMEGSTPHFDDIFGRMRNTHANGILLTKSFDCTLLDPWAVKFASHFQHENNESERHEKIMNGNYAIMGNIVGSAFFPVESIRDEDMRGYRLMKNSVDRFYPTFAVQPWLLDSVDKLILRFQQSGLIEYHLRDVINRRTTSANYEVLVEYDGPTEGAKVLTVTPLGAGFSFLAIGLILATIVFLCELKSASKGQSIFKILRTIKKNRDHWKAQNIRKPKFRRFIR